MSRRIHDPAAAAREHTPGGGMNLVIVEDHPLMREAVRLFVEQEGSIRVVGETGAAAVDMILTLRPDVVLLDLHLQDSNGLAVAERVLSKLPELRILVFSSHLDDWTLEQVDKLGLHGYYDKAEAGPEVLPAALLAVAAGGTYFSARWQATKAARMADPHYCMKLLSATEQAVLSCIAHGMADGEIAHKLGIVPATAQTHRSHIMRKLGIDCTGKLVAYARLHGFGFGCDRG